MNHGSFVRLSYALNMPFICVIQVTLFNFVLVLVTYLIFSKLDMENSVLRSKF
uniref:Uncharacterized protein n=1 Tax=Oryza brachyantha TaxID=4533 RepID=J3L199_ORYBR